MQEQTKWQRKKYRKHPRLIKGTATGLQPEENYLCDYRLNLYI